MTPTTAVVAAAGRPALALVAYATDSTAVAFVDAVDFAAAGSTAAVSVVAAVVADAAAVVVAATVVVAVTAVALAFAVAGVTVLFGSQQLTSVWHAVEAAAFH